MGRHVLIEISLRKGFQDIDTIHQREEAVLRKTKGWLFLDSVHLNLPLMFHTTLVSPPPLQ